MKHHFVEYKKFPPSYIGTKCTKCGLNAAKNYFRLLNWVKNKKFKQKKVNYPVLFNDTVYSVVVNSGKKLIRIDCTKSFKDIMVEDILK